MLLRARLLALVAVALAGEEACDESGDTRGDTGSTSTLRVIHVTDVYQLDNLPSLGALIEEKRNELAALEPGAQTVSVLTGDFLMPYLLSTVDHGVGMMRMLNAIPIDILTWGNHEHDLPHAHVMAREREYQGIWINSNMQDHASFQGSTSQVDSTLLGVASNDGTNSRKVGLLAVLTDEAALYRPNAFGGATIDDPWETMAVYNAKLKDAGADLVLPLCHLYEWQDDVTAERFDFPLVLGGHDHHPVDRVINGTRMLKPGQDAHVATVIDIRWPDGGAGTEPVITANHLKTVHWPREPALQEIVTESYSVLDHLRQTQLAAVPPAFRPFVSTPVREARVSVATYLCTAIRDALALFAEEPGATEPVVTAADVVLIHGGYFKAGVEYPADRSLTLEVLRGEIMDKEVIWVCKMPGRHLRHLLAESWQSPNPAWFQADDGVITDDNGVVVKVAGAPLDPDRLYSIATFIAFRRRRDSARIADYFEVEHPEHWPAMGTGVKAARLLLAFFAARAWAEIVERLDIDGDGTLQPPEYGRLDVDSEGEVSQAELKEALAKILRFETHPDEHALVDAIRAQAMARGQRGLELRTQ